VRLGGQAVIEGVMIRAGESWAVAARRPDGAIVSQQATVPPWAGALKKIPVARGALALVATVGLGMKALSWSRTVAEGESARKPSKASVLFATTVSVGIMVALFAVLPAVTARALVGEGGVAFGAAEAVLRLLLFIGYVAAIGRLPGIRRTFEYHGAEHQAVAAYEAGAPLDVDTVRPFSPRHARCGTDFLVLVALVAVAAFALVSPEAWWALLVSRVLLLPVVAGVAYELLRLSDRPSARLWLKPLLAPGFAVQRLTTKNPTDDQIEVAIAAVQAALAGVPA
jgi:uncharacterized protein YqhQ